MEVDEFSSELKSLLDSMWNTMVKEKGLGLSANQVGLSQRMFVMEGPNKERYYIVNPEIVAMSPLVTYVKEGCLSAPGEILVTGNRRLWTMIKFKDENGSSHAKVFEGVHSVCVQHEIEHLNGQSFLQSKTIPKRQRAALGRKWGFKTT